MHFARNTGPSSHRIPWNQVAALLGCLIATAGCAWKNAGRPADDLEIRTPGTWQAASSGREKQISTDWLGTFKDRDLTRTVDEALENNRDLRVAAARMREAREDTILARARMRPNVTAGGGTTTIDGSSRPGTTDFALSVASSWEIDLWGRLRDLTRAAEAQEFAAIEDFRGARLSLAAATARAWCNLISSEQDLTLAADTLESFEKNLRIVERTYRGTGEGALDIQFSRTNVSSAARILEQSKLNRDQAAQTLEVLLGRYPGGGIRSVKELPRLPKSVPAGLPADLLDRRPDLSAARYRLFASARRADAARKALLPGVALTGNAGSQSASFTDLLDANRLLTTISSRFTQAIYQGGGLEAEIRATLAQNDAALNAYAQLALEAFREVEAALAADRSLATQEDFLAREVSQAALAEKQSERDYSEGINPNILNVLEAQRRAFNARAAMVRLQNQRLLNRINLHLALGGDFHTRPAL